jgi:hypothetical protein
MLTAARISPEPIPATGGFAMSASRFILATVAGGVVLFILGFLIYGIALASFFEANALTPGLAREVPDFLFLGIGQLALAAVLVLVVSKWRGADSLAGGFKAGAILGFLIAIAWDFTMYGTMQISNMTATLVDPLLAIVYMGIAGAVVGAVMGGRTAPAA